MEYDFAHMLKEIAEVASDVLNEWECEFIESMEGKKYFSEKQQDVIRRIYDKVCSSPL